MHATAAHSTPSLRTARLLLAISAFCVFVGLILPGEYDSLGYRIISTISRMGKQVMMMTQTPSGDFSWLGDAGEELAIVGLISAVLINPLLVGWLYRVRPLLWIDRLIVTLMACFLILMLFAERITVEIGIICALAGLISAPIGLFLIPKYQRPEMVA
jgi:hypothetical protein